MSILIQLVLYDGTVHQCDETCYNETKPRRTCICRGLNTGQGATNAHRNTVRQAIKLFDQITSDFPAWKTLTTILHRDLYFHYKPKMDPSFPTTALKPLPDQTTFLTADRPKAKTPDLRSTEP